MNDLISKNTVIDVANILKNRTEINGNNRGSEYARALSDLVKLIKGLTPVSQEKPVGKWKYISATHPQDYFLQCPFCARKYWYKHNMPIEPLSFNYCPFCGSKMERGSYE